jgi:hypothetical protein
MLVAALASALLLAGCTWFAHVAERSAHAADATE